MKELDFDELDRAVNSLMAGAATAATPTEPAEKVLTIPTTIDPAPSSESGTALKVASSPVPPKEPQTTTSPRPTTPSLSSASTQPSLATRRGGRFMDVVRPADKKPAPTPRPLSREGVTISAPQPVASAIASGSIVADEAAQDVQTPDADETVPSWPDPIDFHKDTTAHMEPDTAGQATDVVKPTTDLSEEPSEPLQTPFITDAKVEKRPLGAFTQPAATSVAEAAPDTAEAEGPQSDDTDTDPQIPGDAAATVLPEELKSDIVAIESDATVVEETKVAPTATPAPTQPQAAPATVNLGQTSIQQQYKEEPSTTPAEHAPIYDSEPIQAPLAHPAKKKTGWLVVLLIIGLLILGAGAGTAIYFFVL